MSNLKGQNFDTIIRTQVEKRQEKLGLYQNIDNDVLTWMNAKTAWIRLASSIDIDGDSTLSKQNVLLGGVLNYNFETDSFGDILANGAESWNLKKGFDETYTKSITGFRPMSSILGVKINFKGNQGSIKEGELRLKANSIEEFEKLNKLYLKPGYSVLLEWGHTIYLNNNGEVERFNNFNTIPFNLFFKGDDFNVILTKIDEERKKYYGNYDAFLGKISGFNWTFNKDGTYDITLKILSLGDIIESLKMNQSVTSEIPQELDRENKPYLELLKDVTLFNKFLYDCSTGVDINNKYNLKIATIIKKEFQGNKTSLFSRSFGARKNNNQYYITLGGLLEYLEKHQNLYINQNKILYLNYDYEDDNYCLTFPGHFSSDPSVCIIPVADLIQTQKKIQLDDSRFNSESLYVGKLMYILVNLELVASLLFSLRDEQTGNVSLFNLLKNILTKINNSLGNVNSLNVFYDVDENKIKIIEEAPLKLGEHKEDQFTKFNLYGVGVNNGSFVKNIGLNVAIDNMMATNIAIGTSPNNNQPGYFSVFSSVKGYIDRTSPEKTPTTDNNITTSEVTETGQIPEQKYNKIIDKLNQAVNQMYLSKLLDEETIKTVESISSDYFKYKIGYLSGKQIPFRIFIRFRINLELEGISGIKILNAFKVSENTQQVIPKEYKDNFFFMVTKVDHSIEGNQWKTNIEALTVPELKETTALPIINNYVQELRQQQNNQVASSTTTGREKCKIKDIPKNVKYLELAEVYNYFIGKNYSKQAASSLTATLLNESSLNLNAFNSAGGGCGAYGIAQWRSRRQDNLFDYAQSIGKSIDDKESQLGFIIHELNTVETTANLKLKKAQTLEAANLAAVSYERFSGYNNPSDPEVVQRLADTKKIYNVFA